MKEDEMDYPDFLVERVVEEHEERVDSFEENLYHVTDLCYCSLKREFKRKYPSLHQVKPYQIMGIVVEKGIQRLIECGLDVTCNVRETKKVGEYKITGEADILTEEKVIDVKSPKKMWENKLHEQYNIQVRLYEWLFNRKKGEIWYASPNWLGKKEAGMPYKDAQVLELIEGGESPKFPSWECKYCMFQGICEKAKIKGGK